MYYYISCLKHSSSTLFSIICLEPNSYTDQGSTLFSFNTDNAEMGKDLEIGIPKNLDLQLEYPDEVPTKVVGSKQANLHEIGSSNLNKDMTRRQLDLNSESPSNKLKSEDLNLTGVTTNSSDPRKDSTEFGAPNRTMISDNKAISDTKESPSLELSLKRLRGVKDVGTTIRDDRNVLRRSDSSAFSRYGKSLLTLQENDNKQF